jgi:hypothetical protein
MHVRAPGSLCRSCTGHVARAALVACLLVSPAAAQFVQVPGVGHEGQGADIVVTNLDGNPRPDMLLMAYDNPSGANDFRYKVGLNLAPNGQTGNWTPGFVTIPGLGHEGQGAGLAVTNLDGDARPELIAMAYDNPAGANTFRYRVGFNVNAAGIAASWTPGFVTVPGVGHEGQGADVLITNLDDNLRPEMLLMAYDNPGGANNFRYKIGWNLDGAGNAAVWDPGFVMVDGVGHEGQGAGAAIANLDNDPRPELLLLAYDNPSGANGFRVRIGRNLGTNGVAQSWDPGFIAFPGFGHEGQGAGLALANLDDDASFELFLMAYDNPGGANSFRYAVRSNWQGAQPIWLEMDKLAAVAWPPASATRNGVSYTLAGIHRELGFAIDPRQNQASIADPLPGTCFSDADLDGFLSANRNSPPPAGSSSWWMYAAFLTCDTDGNLGVMFDGTDRRGFGVFMNAFGSFEQTERRLRTTAHELGHALCLYHSDGDAWRPGGPLSGQGRTVMNQTGTLATDWDYGWSAGSRHKIADRSKRRWRPQSGFAFGSCH